jgi:ABC-type transporter Mla subunit MlaD
MIDVQKLESELQALEYEARLCDVYGAERLQALRDAVSGQAPSAPWIGADVHALVAPDLIVEAYRASRQGGGQPWESLLRLLEGLRNVIIFLPIVVTWFGISQASMAYQAMLQPCLARARSGCPSDSTQPFLYLWEQGFDGHLSSWFGLHPTLSLVGLIDASILLLVIGLTLLVMLLNRREERLLERRVQIFHSRLVQALTGATLLLRHQPAAHSAGENLAAVAERIDDMAKQVLQTFERLGDRLGQRFESVAQEMEKRFTQVADQFKGVANDLTTSTRQINQEFTQQLHLGKGLLETLRTLVENGTRVAGELSTCGQSLLQASTTISEGLRAVAVPLENLHQQHGALLKEIAASSGHLKQAATDFEKVSSSWKRLLDAVEVFDLAIGKLDHLGETLDKAAQASAGFLVELRQERSEQAKLAQSLAEAVQNMRDDLQLLEQHKVAIHSIVVDMYDTLRLQAAFSAGSGPAALRSVNGVNTVVQGLEEGGRDLRAAALQLAATAQDLKTIFGDLTQQMRSPRP